MTAPVGPLPPGDERHLKGINAPGIGSPPTREAVVASYFRSLADQGVRLVDANEVAEWLRGELADGLHEDDGGSFVAAFLARFGGGDER